MSAQINVLSPMFFAVLLICLFFSLSVHVLTSVSRGGFNDGASRLQTAITLGLLDHAETDTVFDRSTSVKELALCHYFISWVKSNKR